MSDKDGGIKFLDNDGELIGEIFVNKEGELSFRGKATATAEIFIDEIIRIFNNELEVYSDDDELVAE